MDTRATRLFWILLTLAVAFALSSSAELADSASAADAEEADPSRDAWVLPDEMGAIYKAQCAVCHGQHLEGAAQGPSLLGDLAHGKSVPELVTSISKGFPDKGMPGWTGVISDEDIRGISIYLLEERRSDSREARSGLGEPPVIPTEPVPGEEHDVMLREVFGGLTEPYSIAPLPDGRILVTEKMRGLSIVAADGKSASLVTGTPRFYDDSVLRGTTWAGSGWAHEIALHPDYENNGWLYLSYGDRCKDCNSVSRETGADVVMVRLVRGRLKGSEWVDQELIWEAPKETYQPGLENGAGARIAFDDEGYVYLSLGAFTDYKGIQSLGFPQGKIIRMHDDGRIPKDNPFLDQPGALPGVYTLGHRNPQGLDFDFHTGVMWSSEHGPRGGDEANIIRAGHNYGWPLVSLGVDYDGRPISYGKKYGIEFDPTDLTPATIDWTPSPGVSSIAFYRGNAFPKWKNNLLVATLGGNDLLRVVVDDKGAQHSEVIVDGLARFRDVEVGPSGEVLLLIDHHSGSQILRMEPAK